MNIYLTHLGCRLNESEIEDLAWRFAVAGHQVVDDPVEADWCVVNTCTVTREAGRKSRQMVRRLARLNPDCRIAVTGCHATMAPGEVESLPNVAWVVGNPEKERLPQLIAGANSHHSQWTSGHLNPGTLGRTRAFVKVQDGCDNRCTFCITTVARGEGRSRPLKQVVAEVRELVAAGYKEVVITGVHLGSYGRDGRHPTTSGDQPGETSRDGAGLHGLIEALLCETDVPRLRLSSLEPWDLSPDFFELWSDSRLCRQLHLPLQSGNDRILRRMARRTTIRDYAELVASARTRIPDLALTTDLIVGFPGETEAAFEASYRFVQEMEFARLHVFSYSARAGTAAARMANQVPAAAKTSRSHAMRHLGARLERDFHRRFVGRTFPVLWEQADNSGFWRGHTDNYLTVMTRSRFPLANVITPTRLVETAGKGLRGEVLHAQTG
jgi:threonylcarbamoyladenosine tRNA methylthiotransferase MtaB